MAKRAFDCAQSGTRQRGEYDARSHVFAAQSFAEGCAVPVGAEIVVREINPRPDHPRYVCGHVYRVESRHYAHGVVLRKLGTCN